MSSRVALTVEDGAHKGKRFVFSEHMSCIMGRAPDCNPCLPDDEAHRFISRYHCMLEVNPPAIVVRDFGSLNGTYVNGAKIGQREHHHTPEEGQRMLFPEHTLKDNDLIKLGGTLFRINISSRFDCEVCGVEISPHSFKHAERSPGYYVCDACWVPTLGQHGLPGHMGTLNDEMEPLIPEDNYSLYPSLSVDRDADFLEDVFSDSGRVPEEKCLPLEGPGARVPANTEKSLPVTPSSLDDAKKTPDASVNIASGKRCAKCGKSVSNEVNALGQGQYTCTECRKNPLDLIDEIIDSALPATSDSKTPVSDIEGYRVIRTLGMGGAGIVYLAEESRSGRKVALKVLLPQVAVNPRARKSFMLEAKNTQALHHRNIVELDKYGVINGTFYLALEYCDGGSVDGLVKRKGGRLPLETALVITLQALDGLDYAHGAEIEVLLDNGSTVTSRGLVHRDLKPCNLLLGGSPESRTVKIADYGLGKAFEAAGLSGHTRTGQRAGSPWFMPRQQVINFKYCKPDVDVYGMAASLYYMLTGFHPRDFPKGKDPWQVVLQTKPVPVAERGTSIPPKLASFLDKSLDDSKTLCFSTIEEFRKELKAVISK